jgi:hypothetical protein
VRPALAPVRVAAAAVLLAGPAAVAFASGGYFAEARLWAAIGACVLAAVAAVCAEVPLPRPPAGRLAIAGLAGLLAWTLASRAWAPVVGAVNADAQRLALYLAALVAAAALLRGTPQRWAEPVLAAGAVGVIGYGLSERLLPGLVQLDVIRAADGRLAQPLTYWNAIGALAAVGLVLVARLAGDVTRPRALRIAAGAAAPPLGAGLVLAFSRGAIAAALVGLAVLLALVRDRSQLRAVAAVALGALAAGAIAAALPAVRTLDGAAGRREQQGLALLAALVVVAAAVAFAVARWSRGEPEPARVAAVPLRPRGVLVLAAVACVIGVILGAAALEHSPRAQPAHGATATRLGSAESNRYAYWRVALRGFADEPLHGGGSGSFAVLWLRERTVAEGVRDAHSLELETAAELGIVGIALLVTLIGGVARCAVVALRRDPAGVAAPVAALVAWTAHSALDWDWEMPALTLVAILLAGIVIARADPPPGG